jgi:FlaA1/EpsC-like NDP-sugar epimerase
MAELRNKRILIIGGTGSLGRALTRRLHETNTLYIMSRGEERQWQMKMDFRHAARLHFIVGNIADPKKVEQALIRHNVDVIIMAAALKHIDVCEYETSECLHTNLLGTQNVLSAIETHRRSSLTNLTTVVFVSTDKACSPVNIYGMTKAASECLMIEKAKYIDDVKFVCVRYGNVLNSRGSIIPKLHQMGADPDVPNFSLTDDRMTRFVMTLDQSVSLIEYAAAAGESGDVVIPRLVSCKITDLIQLFSEKYGKPVVKMALRPGEKMLESLINETQSMRLVEGVDGYMHIRPAFKEVVVTHAPRDYNSEINPLSKEGLCAYLKNLDLL